MATNNVLNSPQPFALSIGGTGANLTASNGGIVYSTASALGILSGTATANQVLLSGSSTTPAWSTATYPATTTVSQLLYSSSSNVVAGLATANNSALSTNATGVPTWVSLGTNGYLLIGSGSGAPAAGTLTAGAGITITNAANSITIASSGGGLSWTTVASSSQAAAVNSGYIMNNGASLVTVTLPATAAVGSVVAVIGSSSGGWTLAANTGQTIQFGNVASTSGGSWSSGNQYDNIYVVCTVANTTWSVISAVSAGLTKA